MEDRGNRDGESDGRMQPKLLIMSGNTTEKVHKMPIFLSHALLKTFKEIVYAFGKYPYFLFYHKLDEKMNGKLTG